jgi:beta-ureidopropionase / N-carbamoyl-L-amino-acid hydrolase
MTPTVKPVVNDKRLLTRLSDLAKLGATKDGGVCRLALTDNDRLGRDFLVALMQDANLHVRIDQIGNIFGIRRGQKDLPAVMTGSHPDTVRNGGKYDGAYGILAGLEVIETLNDLNIETIRPIIVCAFTNEEGARFHPDMMGSLVYAGGLELDTALSTCDANGLTLGQELKRIAYDGDMPCGDIVPRAFIEVHIEQGPILEREEIQIGVVENLQGISWQEVIFHGQANHAGTTPMQGRKDAGFCAAALAVYVRELSGEFGGNQVATIGEIELTPNVINVVPNRARITIDIRNTNNAILCLAEQQIKKKIEELAASENTTSETRVLARFDPVLFDQDIASIIEENAIALNLSHRRMTSGAGHDAQMMSRICPAAMIFVPSKDGISHNPREHTDADDLVAGANVLLHSLLTIANE